MAASQQPTVTVSVDGEERFSDETDPDHDYRARFDVDGHGVEIEVGPDA